MPTSVQNGELVIIPHKRQRLTRVGERFHTARINLGLQDRVEVYIEADSAARLAVLQNRLLQVLLGGIRLELAKIEGREPEVCVRPVLVVVPNLEQQVLRQRVDENELGLHPCRVGPVRRRPGA